MGRDAEMRGLGTKEWSWLLETNTFLIKSSGSVFKFAWKIHELGLRCLYRTLSAKWKSALKLKSTWAVLNMKWRNQRKSERKQQILNPQFNKSEESKFKMHVYLYFSSLELQRVYTKTSIETQNDSFHHPLLQHGRFGEYMIYEFKMKRERNWFQKEIFYGAQQSNRGDQVRNKLDFGALNECDHQRWAREGGLFLTS